ncbi:cold-shock protein (plasmid) [Paraburkholderia pallida]|uniref:Cold-shock protein n=1 Tax=Paraburkholderia pallida TaxID=2547399 RepID=A0A4P7D8D5_9BURK|nr:cold-shock protein [Paraburkholderia pallida]
MGRSVPAVKGLWLHYAHDGGEDLFAHSSEVEAEGFKSLKDGQKASVVVKQGPNGKEVANIQPS